MTKYVLQAQKLYPKLNFVSGKSFAWDAWSQTVTFPEEFSGKYTYFLHGLAHEISHSLLNHRDFKHDVDLIKMERDAWSKAREVLKSFNLNIDQSHVDDCLDTYRDWLYARSKCPQCELVSIQTDTHHYFCPHCVITWKVPSSRLCTVKRKILAN